MLHVLQQLATTGLPQQTPTVPELPPGPSLDRVRGPVEIPVLEPWQSVLIALLGIAVLGLIGWKCSQIMRRRAKPKPIAPKDAALAELKSAAETTAGDDEQFAVLNSLALRRYFETRYDLNSEEFALFRRAQDPAPVRAGDGAALPDPTLVRAGADAALPDKAPSRTLNLGKTTEEFLKRLNEHSLLDEDSRKSLAAFMQQCDRVKFAKAPLTEAERCELTESALELIRRCEATRAETNQPNVHP